MSLSPALPEADSDDPDLAAHTTVPPVHGKGGTRWLDTTDMSPGARHPAMLGDYLWTHEAGPASHVIRFPRGPACRRFETTPGRSSSLGLPPAKLRGRKALGDQRFSSITQHWTRKSAASRPEASVGSPPSLTPLRLNPAWEHSGSGPTVLQGRLGRSSEQSHAQPQPASATGQSTAGSRIPNPWPSAGAARRAPRLRPRAALPGPPPGTRTSRTQVSHTPLSLT